MRKTLLFITFLSVALFSSAQETTVAVGTNYGETLVAMNSEPAFVMGGSVLDTRDIAGFQQSKTTFSNYSRDQKIAIAGWSLFSIGTAFLGAGVGIWVAAINDDSDDAGEIAGDIVARAPAGFYMMIGGGAVLASGIVCLGVSYHRMGGHANLTDSGIRERKPLMTFNLQSSRDGLGFAIRF